MEDELDKLTDKLSNININGKKEEEEDIFVMKSLQDVISKMKL